MKLEAEQAEPALSKGDMAETLKDTAPAIEGIKVTVDIYSKMTRLECSIPLGFKMTFCVLLFLSFH